MFKDVTIHQRLNGCAIITINFPVIFEAVNEDLNEEL